MKIQSHNLEMHSKSISYKTMQKSELSFESFITDDETQNNLKRFDYDNERTLCEIVNDLIAMLKGRINQKPLREEDVVGYTHISLDERYEEHESLEFSTKGCIRTDTGEMSIDINFSMSRDFVVENRIDIYSPFDPLVINLDGELPQLTSNTFSFDLDNDGTQEQLASLGSGCGFLAYDKNADGIINDGSELFGTQSGDGFSELSAFDEDGNGWIDESDTIFDKLQVWLKDDKTQEKELIALGDAGVGAIFLDSAQGDYTYKTPHNDILGKMKSSGIFLKEDGSVGSIAEIDLNIANKTKEQTPLSALLQA